MKTKRFFLFLLFAAGLLMTGCTEKVIMPGGAQVVKLDYDVRASQWELYGDCFRATLDVRDITSSVVARGKVDVSRCYRGELDGQDVLTPLPYIRTEMTEVDGNDYIFTTFIDYEWYKGTVNIYVTTSDLFTEYNPGDMSFRVYVTK